jgi:hypothetical protein
LVKGNNLIGMWVVLQNGLPCFKGLDNCEKFFVINLIIYLDWRMLPLEISHRVEKIINIIL